MKKKPKGTKSSRNPNKPMKASKELMPGRRITAKDVGYLSPHCYVTTMHDVDPPIPIPKNRRRKR